MLKSWINLGFLLCGLLLAASRLYAQEKKPIDLNTVTIKGTNKPLKETAKGAILDISKIPNAKTLTLAELLSHIPGIEVSGSTISYMGNTLTVLRDGVDVAGFGSQISSALNSGNVGNSFTKIELNLFNLKTESPTLSFVAPKYDEGYLVSINANAGTNSTMAMANASLSRKKYLLNFNTNAMLQYGPGSTNYIETDYFNTQTHESRTYKVGRTDMNNYLFSLSNSYFINAKHTLNASVSKGLVGYSYSMVNNMQQYQSNNLNNSSITELDNLSPIANNPSLTTKLSYVFKIRTTEKLKERFDIALDYENTETQNQNTAATQSLLSNFLPNSNYISLKNVSRKNIFGLVAYEYDHEELGDFEFVARYFNRKNYESYDYVHEIDAAGNLENLFQDNNIRYNYAALLGAWSKSFKGISFRAVVKQDYSVDDIDNLKGREHFKFSTFSPYISLQRSLKKGSLRFEARYSQLRPHLNNLSGIVNYGAQYNINNVVTIGNPFLKPSKSLYFSGIYTTTIKAVNLVFTGHYTNVDDAISAFETTNTDNVRIRNYRNLAHTNNYVGNLTLNFYLLPRFTVQLFTNNAFKSFKVDDKETRNTYRWAEGVRFSYTPVPNIRLGANAGISGGTSFQNKMRSQVSSDISAGYTKNKMNFNLSISNFHQPYLDNDSWTYGYGYQTHTKSRSRTITGMLTLSYSFGKIFRKATVNGKEIAKDDM